VRAAVPRRAAPRRHRLCVEIRKRVDEKLAENAALAKPHLEVDAEISATRLGKCVTALSTAASLAELDAAVAELVGSGRRLEDLQAEERQLAAADGEKAAQALRRQSSKLATGPITKKILELSEESITELVRDAFVRETERLRLDRVTISRTRAERGALLHLPKLVGTRQDATLPRVFSEGERTALGLAKAWERTRSAVEREPRVSG
jgi:hypothetical protein